jgi:hypothetical protein
MVIRVTNENPLEVTVDGVPSTVLTYIYLDGSIVRAAKYVIVNGVKYLIRGQYGFDVNTIP